MAGILIERRPFARVGGSRDENSGDVVVYWVAMGFVRTQPLFGKMSPYAIHVEGAGVGGSVVLPGLIAGNFVVKGSRIAVGVFLPAVALVAVWLWPQFRSSAAGRGGFFPTRPRLWRPRLSTAGPYAPCPPNRDLGHETRLGLSCAAKLERSAHTPTASPDSARGQRGSPFPAREDNAGSGWPSPADLEKALRHRPASAARHSDLAAAFLVEAETLDAPAELVRALEEALEAVELDSRSAPARFNLALATQTLGLRHAALASWGRYLELDPGSSWAEEAREQATSLMIPPPASRWSPAGIAAILETGDSRVIAVLVAENRQAAREHAEQRLLPAWGQAQLAGDAPVAARLLRQARQLGQQLEACGEPLLRETVAAIDNAAPRDLPALAAAHRLFGDLYGAYNALRSSLETAHLMAELADRFASLKSPAWIRTAIFAAAALQNTGRYEEAIVDLARIEALWAGTNDPSLRGHLAWVRAISEQNLGHLTRALTGYEAALGLFSRAGEDDNAAMLLSLVADVRSSLGQSRTCWRYWVPALRRVAELGNPRHRFTIVATATDALIRQGRSRAALVLQQEGMTWSRAELEETKSATHWEDALLWRAFLHHRNGQGLAALSDLDQARRALAQEVDPDLRQHNGAVSDWIEGLIVSGKDPHRAIGSFSRALAVFDGADQHILGFLARKHRAEAHKAMGDSRAAEADFAQALAMYRGFGVDPSFDNADLRLAFTDGVRDLFTQLVAWQAEAGRWNAAFLSCDQSHTQLLRLAKDAPSGELEPGLSDRDAERAVAQIAARIPAGTTLVQLAELPDRLLVWWLRRGGRLEHRTIPIPATELEALITRYVELEEGTGGWDAWRPVSEELYRLLVSPWQGASVAGERVVFVPDQALNAMPFASLRDSATGRYLVETYRTAKAPSATLYLAAVERGHALDRQTGKLEALLVGDPPIDPGVFPELAPLPGARREAEALAKLYPGARLFVDRQATLEAFNRNAPQAQMIHFAGHAVAHEESPLDSMLLFAPTGSEDPGFLKARDIERLRLDRTRLVVLPACSSDRGAAATPAEGFTTLAWAFLEAGAPAVVAALWSLDDETTAPLMVSFHRHLRAGQAPESALRTAQLERLQGGPSARQRPSTWAWLEVIGAGGP